jgi:hypothetical protein
LQGGPWRVRGAVVTGSCELGNQGR